MKQIPASWWTTARGRGVAYGIVAFAGASTTIGTFFPQTVLIKTYKEYMHVFKGGEPVPLPDEIRQKFDKCLDILKIDDRHKKHQTPFTVFGFDLFHAGNAYTRQGAIIGIPVNYQYKSEFDIHAADVQIDTKPVKWSTPAGEQLASSLVLPENQQIFGICREILSTQNYQLYLNTVYPVMTIMLTYASTQAVNIKLALFARPSFIRYTFYTLISLFALGSYCLAADYTQMMVENAADEKLSKLGPEFIKSGIEFYNNLIQRNQALRQLMEDGESSYSKAGNDLFYFRQKTIPITMRKNFFEEKLKEYNEKENSTIPSL